MFKVLMNGFLYKDNKVSIVFNRGREPWVTYDYFKRSWDGDRWVTETYKIFIPEVRLMTYKYLKRCYNIKQGHGYTLSDFPDYNSLCVYIKIPYSKDLETFLHSIFIYADTELVCEQYRTKEPIITPPPMTMNEEMENDLDALKKYFNENSDKRDTKSNDEITEKIYDIDKNKVNEQYIKLSNKWKERDRAIRKYVEENLEDIRSFQESQRLKRFYRPTFDSVVNKGKENIPHYITHPKFTPEYCCDSCELNNGCNTYYPCGFNECALNTLRVSSTNEYHTEYDIY